MQIQADEDSPAYHSWKIHAYQSSERSILAFSKGLIRSLAKENENRVDLDKLERWLQVNPTFLIMWREIFSYVYSKNAGKLMGKLGRPSGIHILPTIEGIS